MTCLEKNIESEIKITCKMMLQPTSGRQGFDYVKDPRDIKGK